MFILVLDKIVCLNYLDEIFHVLLAKAKIPEVAPAEFSLLIPLIALAEHDASIIAITVRIPDVKVGTKICKIMRGTEHITIIKFIDIKSPCLFVAL